MTQEVYKLELDNVFEGPMELLITLIKKEKVDIFDIPIALITDKFISHISGIDFENVGLALDFTNMASTLLEIKSKMLLPKEDSEIEEDPRFDLVSRIIEYNHFKEVSKVLGNYFEIGDRRLLKKSEDLTMLSTEEFDYIDSDIDSLTKVLIRILNRKVKEDREEEIELPKEVFTLEKSLKIIRQKIHNHKSISFTSLFNLESTKGEIIAFFLAMLELAKLNEIVLRQKLQDEDEIYIYRR